MVCLQGGRATLATGLTLTRVYKQNFTGRVPYNRGQPNARLHAKDLETVTKLTPGGELNLPGVFKKVNPPARVTLARR